MKLSIRKIGEFIDAEIHGDESVEVCGMNSFEDATASDITFASDSRFLGQMEKTRAGAVIVPESYPIENRGSQYPVFLKTPHPKKAFFDLVAVFHPAKISKTGIHPTSVIGDDVIIGKDTIIEPGVVISDRVCIGDHVHLMPHVYIGSDCTIGGHTVIKPNVSIMERSVIGSHVLIHSGCVIGSDGYGFTHDSEQHEKIIHTGSVHIGDHVEIGACNTIDRGTLGKTIIGSGVKTDNQVHIAHNVKIGNNALIVAQVGIAGSTRLGKNVIVAGKAGISGHLEIGDNAIVGPYAGVHSNVPPNEVVSGIPQMPHGRWRKVVSIVSRLPEMRKKLFSFDKRLKELENKKK